MFEEIATSGAGFLIVLFWASLLFIFVWGALWVRANRRKA
jgi:hypothetical protein